MCDQSRQSHRCKLCSGQTVFINLINKIIIGLSDDDDFDVEDNARNLHSALNSILSMKLPAGLDANPTPLYRRGDILEH